MMISSILMKFLILSHLFGFLHSIEIASSSSTTTSTSRRMSANLLRPESTSSSNNHRRWSDTSVGSGSAVETGSDVTYIRRRSADNRVKYQRTKADSDLKEYRIIFLLLIIFALCMSVMFISRYLRQYLNWTK